MKITNLQDSFFHCFVENRVNPEKTENPVKIALSPAHRGRLGHKVPKENRLSGQEVHKDLKVQKVPRDRPGQRGKKAQKAKRAKMEMIFRQASLLKNFTL